VTTCFLHGYGACSEKLSKEHYISKTVLEAIGSNGSTQIGGLPWQPDQTLLKIGIQSLVSRILCETHNSGLSSLDSVAGTLFRALNAADKSPETLPSATQIDGPLLERWFIKVLCGLSAAAGFNNGLVPDQWKPLLLGAQWPQHWGLYLPALPEPQVLAKELLIETVMHPETKAVLAATFSLAGVKFKIVLGRPDNPTAWGLHRPRGLIFRHETGEKGIEFVWPHKAEQAVIYTKVGTTSKRPRQWDGWKE